MTESSWITAEECAQAWKAFEIPGPRRHPCLFFDQAEIDESVRLSRIKSTRQYKERRKTVEKADVLLGHDLSIVRKGWQGESRWACVNCGSREVEIRRDSPDEGRCLRCGTVNDDTAFRSWWVVEMHGRSLRQLRVLTWAYLFTGEEAYAGKALKIMMEYAEWLPDCPVKGDWRLRFSVDPQLDMRFGIQMAYDYDLLYEYSGWTNEKRRTFETNVLRSTVKLNLERWPEFWLHNMYNTGCALMAAVGLCLGEPGYVDRAVNEKYGLIRSLGEGVNGDGFWVESTLNYHLAVVRDMVSLTEALYHAGFDFYRVNRYRKMFLGPLELAEPTTGIMSSWGDGGNFCPDVFQGDTFLAAYETLYRRTSDPMVGAYLKSASARGRLSTGSVSLKEGWRDETVGTFAPPSALMKVQGLAALHAGRGKDAKYLRLNFLREIGGHHQADRLNLLAFARGGFVGPKYRQSDYSTPAYEWARQAIGHNTVTIGAKTQEPEGGKLAFYAGFEPIQVVSAQADQIYPGYQQQRTAILVGNRYVVDLLRVYGDKPNLIDWVWHCKGELQHPANASSSTVHGDGAYKLVDDAVSYSTDQPWQARWILWEPDLGFQPPGGLNPYEDVIDWTVSTKDFIVRVKRDGRRVKVYNNITGHPLYPHPLLSPVFSSVYNYGPEFSMLGKPLEPPDSEQRGSQPCGYFALTMTGQADTEVYHANGPGYPWDTAPMPLLVARRHAAWTNFMTALDTYQKDPYVLSVHSLANTPVAAVMQVTTQDSRETFAANYGNSELKTDDVYLEGEFAAISVQRGKASWAVLVNASCFRLDDLRVEAHRPGTFLVERNASGQWQAHNTAGEAFSMSIESG